jgi:formamidopyrimidine-DNA glycosylase
MGGLAGMPELPEVETIRRGLEPLVKGRKVLQVTVRERRMREPIDPRALARLRGSQWTGIRRRSKFLLLDTDGGWTLLVHLGMTGHLWVSEAGRPQRAHEHVVIALQGNRELRFADARRFGLVRVVKTRNVDRDRLLKGLGPEPLSEELGAEALYRSTRGRRQPVKSFLMDTRALAGIGNIYACEVLYRSGVHPKRAVGRIGRDAWDRLLQNLRLVLQEAIAAGGTTIRDFQNAEGDAGYFAVSLRVYGRAGEACSRCGARIRRIVQSGRSTFYCPHCQGR